MSIRTRLSTAIAAAYSAFWRSWHGLDQSTITPLDTGADARIAADYGIPPPTGNPGEVLEAFGGFVKVDNRATPDAPSIGEGTGPRGMTEHQQRAALIDWSDSPAWATHYVIRYAPYLDGPKTLAVWGDGVGEKTEDAKAYFKLREDERNKPIVFSFGESQAAKQLLHQLQQMDRVGELSRDEQRAADQGQRA